jgi:hypothetical protein
MDDVVSMHDNQGLNGLWWSDLVGESQWKDNCSQIKRNTYIRGCFLPIERIGIVNIE